MKLYLTFDTYSVSEIASTSLKMKLVSRRDVFCRNGASLGRSIILKYVDMQWYTMVSFLK